MVDAINHALDEELANNPKMLIYGEDVAGGKGGVFTATQGLTKKYGDRVFISPLAESSIVGTAIGLAVMIGKIATGEIEDEREGLSSAAAQLGSKGGKKRAENMTPERRAEIAKAAAAKRWGKT